MHVRGAAILCCCFLLAGCTGVPDRAAVEAREPEPPTCLDATCILPAGATGHFNATRLGFDLLIQSPFAVEDLHLQGDWLTWFEPEAFDNHGVLQDGPGFGRLVALNVTSRVLYSVVVYNDTKPDLRYDQHLLVQGHILVRAWRGNPGSEFTLEASHEDFFWTQQRGLLPLSSLGFPSSWRASGIAAKGDTVAVGFRTDDAPGPVNSQGMHVLNLTTGEWRRLPSTPGTRDGLALAMVGRAMFVGVYKPGQNLALHRINVDSGLDEDLGREAFIFDAGDRIVSLSARGTAVFDETTGQDIEDGLSDGFEGPLGAHADWYYYQDFDLKAWNMTAGLIVIVKLPSEAGAAPGVRPAVGHVVRDGMHEAMSLSFDGDWWCIGINLRDPLTP